MTALIGTKPDTLGASAMWSLSGEKRTVARGAFTLNQQKNPQREVDPHREKHQHARKPRQRALPLVV